MLDTRTIAHLDMDTFFVSVERLINPKLMGKPVLVGGFSDRAVVAACSYEARQFGVHSAMPMKRARILCPQAIIVRGDWDAYSEKSREVTSIIADRIPDFEKASIDEHYIDLTGYERYFGAWQWAHLLRERIRKETGLPISMGISENKTISKIATRTAKPDGERQVIHSEVKAFLAPLPVKDIPGIGPKLNQQLSELGIKTIAQLADLPRELLYSIVGKQGIRVWEKANGIDHSPVIPYSEQKSISKEMTFESDVLDMKMIREVLVSMAEGIAYELRRQGKLASTLSVKIRYANFDTHTKDTQLSYTASDHVLIEKGNLLLNKVYDRRMMIRLIGLKVSGLVSGYEQMQLFETGNDMVNLYNKLDLLRNRYGAGAVIRACGMKVHKSKPVLLPASRPETQPQLSPEAQKLLNERKSYYGRGG